MPELPWRKWFPQDWKSDPQLSRCSATTRGIWADAISTMMQQQTFKIEGTDEELARDCRCDLEQIKAAHEELKRTKAAEVSMQNGCKTWVCRRLKREYEISQYRKAAAVSRWCKPHATPMQHPPSDVNANTHARSASVYASSSASTIGGVGERLAKLFGRDGSVPMSYMEQTSILEISKRPDAMKEVSEIEVFNSREKKYFPKSLSSLVTQWDKYLDQARVWKPHRTPQQEQEHQNFLKSL